MVVRRARLRPVVQHHVLLDPGQQEGHVRVDPGPAGLGAARAPGHDARQEAFVRADQRATRVALAGVFASLHVAGADLALDDGRVVVLLHVHVVALLGVDDGKVDGLQVVWYRRIFRVDRATPAARHAQGALGQLVLLQLDGPDAGVKRQSLGEKEQRDVVLLVHVAVVGVDQRVQDVRGGAGLALQDGARHHGHGPDELRGALVHAVGGRDHRGGVEDGPAAEVGPGPRPNRHLPGELPRLRVAAADDPGPRGRHVRPLRHARHVYIVWLDGYR